MFLKHTYSRIAVGWGGWVGSWHKIVSACPPSSFYPPSWHNLVFFRCISLSHLSMAMECNYCCYVLTPMWIAHLPLACSLQGYHGVICDNPASSDWGMAQATNRADKVQPCMQIRENELEVSVTSGNIYFFFGLTPSRRVRGSASFPNLRKRCLHLRVRENCEVSFIKGYNVVIPFSTFDRQIGARGQQSPGSYAYYDV